MNFFCNAVLLVFCLSELPNYAEHIEVGLFRGLSRSYKHWGDFPDLLKIALEKKPGVTAEVFGIDFPGTGEYYKEVSPTTISGITDFVQAELNRLHPRKKNVKRHLFALSMGGMVAMDYLSRFPGEFDSAVLAGTSNKDMSEWYDRMNPISLVLAAYGILAADLTDVAKQEDFLLKITCNSPECRQRVRDEWIAIQRETPVSDYNILRQLKAAAFFVPPKLKPNIPMYLIHGRKDRIAKVACSRVIAENWGINLYEIDDVGHDVTLEAGPLVANLVSSHILSH